MCNTGSPVLHSWTVIKPYPSSCTTYAKVLSIPYGQVAIKTGSKHVSRANQDKILLKDVR